MKQFVFIKSATEVVSLPSSALLRTEYTSATSISLFFETTKAGKNATTVVVLSVTSGKASDAIRSINQGLYSSGSVLIFDDVKGSSAAGFVTGISSITTTEEPTITGADGADGTDGVDGDNSKVLLDVRFDEAVSKGDPLYITGYNSGQERITVAKADASDSAQMPSIGLAAADGAINTNGQAITIGSLEDVDTSSFSVGNVLYVASGGGLTATKPTGTNLIQNVGKVGRSNVNNGEIVVMAIGRSNDLPNLAEGMMWVGDSSGVPQQQSSKTYGSITCGFFDDINTQTHYLPLNAPPTEQSSDNNSYSDWLCPCDIVVKSVQLRFSNLSGAGNITLTVEKDAIGSGVDTDIESETVAVTATDDYDVVHFLFDNAAASVGEKIKIKIVADADVTGSSNNFAVVVYEADWSTRYTQASGVISS